MTLTSDTLKLDGLEMEFGWISYGFTGWGLVTLVLAFPSREQALVHLRRKISDVSNNHSPKKIEVTESSFYRKFILENFPTRSADMFDQLDTRHWTPFQTEIYRSLVLHSKPGELISYGDLAGLTGDRKRARAVGGAMKRNPIPLLIPCHRVINSTGDLHQYSAYGGLRLKRTLIQLEQKQNLLP